MAKKNGKTKPEKIQCEICACNTKSALHWHHIIPRTDPKCIDTWINVCVICSNCHNEVHDNAIKIIGVFPSTQRPYGRTLVFEKNGKKNVDLDVGYCEIKPESMRLYGQK